MNLQTLRTFQIAARNESMTAAAERLLYSPSSVTMQIRQLETEWGVRLFEKHGRGVRLTPEGRSILGKVEAILSQVDSLERVVKGLDEGETGHLSLAAIEPVGSWLVAPLLADFLRNRPLLEVNYETGSLYAIAERVQEGYLDIAITQEPLPGCPMPFEPLMHEQMVLLMRPDDRLNALPSIQISDLRQTRLVFTETVISYQSIVDHGLVAFGSDHPYGGLEINSVTAAIAFVHQGVGVALLPDYAVSPPPEGLVVRHVEGHTFQRTVGFLYRDFNEIATPRQRVVDDCLVYLRGHLRRIPSQPERAPAGVRSQIMRAT